MYVLMVILLNNKISKYDETVSLNWKFCDNFYNLKEIRKLDLICTKKLKTEIFEGGLKSS